MSEQSYTGERIRAELAHIWNKVTLRRRFRQKAAKKEFERVIASLGPNDIAIDLGANIGEFTKPMAKTGARVYAFEPDPHAAELLRKAVKGHENVTIIEAAAGDRNGSSMLYRSARFDTSPDRLTKSSSLFADKKNVDGAKGIEIKIRDFVEFINELDGKIALIKIDVEGAEVPLLEKLLNAEARKRIGHVFVETHERDIPAIAARTRALRQKTRGSKNPAVNWDWH